MAPKHVLEIGQDVAPERPTVLIKTEAKPEGTVHEMRMGTELSPNELAEIARMADQVQKMHEDEIGPAEMELLGVYLDRMLDIAFWSGTPMTDDERETLTPDHKAQLVTAFTTHCLEGAVPAVQNRQARRTSRKTPSRSTGAK